VVQGVEVSKRVYARAIFVMHLRRLPRLRKSVGFVDQEDDRTARLAGCALKLTGFCQRMVESSRQKLRHLTDAALPACGKT
jgi:hypothetical protein